VPRTHSINEHINQMENYRDGYSYGSWGLMRRVQLQV
jgi:hypothetical protein